MTKVLEGSGSTVVVLLAPDLLSVMNAIKGKLNDPVTISTVDKLSREDSMDVLAH